MWAECKVKIPNINRKHSAKNFSCQQKKQKIHNKQFSVLVESRMHKFLISAGNTVPTSFDVRTKYRAKNLLMFTEETMRTILYVSRNHHVNYRTKNS